MARRGHERVIQVEVDTTATVRRGEATILQVNRAGDEAVAILTRDLEKALEEATRQGVGGKLWMAWQSKAYAAKPETGQTPTGYVFPNSGPRTRGAIEANAYGGTIRGRRGQMLAIAFPEIRARMGERGRRARVLTPALFERKTGRKLRPVARAGRPTLLVADKLGGRGWEPIFILLPSVSIRAKFSIANTAQPYAERLMRFMTGQLKLALDGLE